MVLEVPRSPYKIGGPLRWSISACYGHLRGPLATLGALRAPFNHKIGLKKLPKSSDLLSTPLYFGMTYSQILEPYVSNEKNGYAKGFEDFSVFLLEIQKMIDMAKDGCPVPPIYAYMKIEAKNAMKKANLQKVKILGREVYV